MFNFHNNMKPVFIVWMTTCVLGTSLEFQHQAVHWHHLFLHVERSRCISLMCHIWPVGRLLPTYALIFQNVQCLSDVYLSLSAFTISTLLCICCLVPSGWMLNWISLSQKATYALKWQLHCLWYNFTKSDSEIVIGIDPLHSRHFYLSNQEKHRSDQQC